MGSAPRIGGKKTPLQFLSLPLWQPELLLSRLWPWVKLEEQLYPALVQHVPYCPWNQAAVVAFVGHVILSWCWGLGASVPELLVARQKNQQWARAVLERHPRTAKGHG